MMKVAVARSSYHLCMKKTRETLRNIEEKAHWWMVVENSDLQGRALLI